MNSKIFSWTPWAVGHPKSCRDLDRGHRYREDLRLDCHRPFTHPRTRECGLGENLRKYFYLFFGDHFFSFHPPLDIRMVFGRKFRKNIFIIYCDHCFFPLHPPLRMNVLFGRKSGKVFWGMDIGSIYHRTSISCLAPDFSSVVQV